MTLTPYKRPGYLTADQIAQGSKGMKASLRFTRQTYPCPSCEGQGFNGMELCNDCNGVGRIIIVYREDKAFPKNAVVMSLLGIITALLTILALDLMGKF